MNKTTSSPDPEDEDSDFNLMKYLSEDPVKAKKRLKCVVQKKNIFSKISS